MEKSLLAVGVVRATVSRNDYINMGTTGTVPPAVGVVRATVSRNIYTNI